MMRAPIIYTLFADIFRYPDAQFTTRVLILKETLQEQYPSISPVFEPFADYMMACSDYDQQELYTKTFDVQPICYLDLGYVIFGEDYKRGAFLLHMQQEQQKMNNDCGSDLSDNLCNILTLIPRSNDEEFIQDLVHQIMIPGLQKMMSEFASARVDLKVQVLRKLHKAIIQEELNQGNVYKNALESLLMFFRTEYPEPVKSEEQVAQAFLQGAHHQSFFNKNSVSREVNEIINNYNID